MSVQGSTASELKNIIVALDPDSVAAECRNVQQFVKDRGEDGESAMNIVMPKSAATFRKFDWVPASMKSQCLMPENVASFGQSWIMHNLAASYRCGIDVWPAPGCGGFFHCLEGKALVLMWPMQWHVSVSVELEDAFAFFGGMGTAQFQKFWDSDIYHCLLEPPETAWIPHGYAVAVTALADDQFTCMFTPVANTSLMASVRSDVLESVITATTVICQDEFFEGSALRRISEPYLEWLKGIAQNRA